MASFWFRYQGGPVLVSGSNQIPQGAVLYPNYGIETFRVYEQTGDGPPDIYYSYKNFIAGAYDQVNFGGSGNDPVADTLEIVASQGDGDQRFIPTGASSSDDTTPSSPTPLPGITNRIADLTLPDQVNPDTGEEDGFCNEETRISTHPCNSLFPAVSFDKSGNIGYVWQDNRDGNFEVYFRMMKGSESLDAIQSLDSVKLDANGRPIGLGCTPPSLAGVSGFSSFSLADRCKIPSSTTEADEQLEAESLAASVNESCETRLTCSEGASLFPDIEADTKGRFHVVYQDDDATGTHIWHTVVHDSLNGPPKGCSGSGTGTNGGTSIPSGGDSFAEVEGTGSDIVTLIFGTKSVSFKSTGASGSKFAYGDPQLVQTTPHKTGDELKFTGIHKFVRDDSLNLSEGKYAGVSLGEDRTVWDKQIAKAQTGGSPSLVAGFGTILSPGDFGEVLDAKSIAFLVQAPPDKDVEISKIGLPLGPKCAPRAPASRALSVVYDLRAATKYPLPPAFVDPADIQTLLNGSNASVVAELPPRFRIEGDSSGTIFTNLLCDDPNGGLNLVVFRKAGPPADSVKFVVNKLSCQNDPCMVIVDPGQFPPTDEDDALDIEVEVWRGSDYRPDRTQIESAAMNGTLLAKKRFFFEPGEDIRYFTFDSGELTIPAGAYVFLVAKPSLEKMPTVQIEGVGNGHTIWTSENGTGDFAQYYSPFTLQPNLGLDAPVYYEGILLDPAEELPVDPDSVGTVPITIDIIERGIRNYAPVNNPDQYGSVRRGAFTTSNLISGNKEYLIQKYATGRLSNAGSLTFVEDSWQSRVVSFNIDSKCSLNRIAIPIAIDLAAWANIDFTDSNEKIKIRILGTKAPEAVTPPAAGTTGSLTFIPTPSFSLDESRVYYQTEIPASEISTISIAPNPTGDFDLTNPIYLPPDQLSTVFPGAGSGASNDLAVELAGGTFVLDFLRAGAVLPVQDIDSFSVILEPNIVLQPGRFAISIEAQTGKAVYVLGLPVDPRFQRGLDGAQELEAGGQRQGSPIDNPALTQEIIDLMIQYGIASSGRGLVPSQGFVSGSAAVNPNTGQTSESWTLSLNSYVQAIPIALKVEMTGKPNASDSAGEACYQVWLGGNDTSSIGAMLGAGLVPGLSQGGPNGQFESGLNVASIFGVKNGDNIPFKVPQPGDIVSINGRKLKVIRVDPGKATAGTPPPPTPPTTTTTNNNNFGIFTDADGDLIAVDPPPRPRPPEGGGSGETVGATPEQVLTEIQSGAKSLYGTRVILRGPSLSKSTIDITNSNKNVIFVGMAGTEASVKALLSSTATAGSAQKVTTALLNETVPTTAGSLSAAPVAAIKVLDCSELDSTGDNNIGGNGDGETDSDGDEKQNIFATVPVKLTNSGTNLHPRLASVGDDLWLVWFGNKSGTNDVYAARYLGGCGIWDAPGQGGSERNVSNFAAKPTASGKKRSAEFPNVAVGRSGVHVAFQGTDENGKFQIYYSKIGPTGEFTDPIKITETPGEALMPDIVVHKVNGIEQITIVWHDNRNGNYEIYSASKRRGKWFSSGQGSEDTRVTASAGDSMFPRVAADKSGNLRSLFHSNRSGANQIYMATYIASALSWDSSANDSQDLTVSASPAEGLHPDIDIFPTGTIATGWFDTRHALESTDEHEEIYGAICTGSRTASPFKCQTPILASNIAENAEAFLDAQVQILDAVTREQVSITRTPEILIKIKAPGAAFYRISNEDGNWCQWKPICTDEGWNPFRPSSDLDTASIPWTLSCGNGQKTVTIQVQNQNIVGFPIRANVTLTSPAPKVDVELFYDSDFTQSLSVFQGQPVARAGDVFVKITTSEPVYVAPVFDVIHNGLYSVFNQQTSPVDFGSPSVTGASDTKSATRAGAKSLGQVFRGQFKVRKDDGVFNLDGPARVIPRVTGLCGQETTR